MKMNNLYKSSLAYSKLSLFFTVDYNLNLKNTFWGNILRKFYLPFVSESCFFLSILLIWYKGIFIKFSGVFSTNWLALVILSVGFIFLKKDKIHLQKIHLTYLIFLTFSIFSGFLSVLRGIDAGMVFKGWLILLQFGLALFVAEGLNISLRSLSKYIVFLSLPISLGGIYQLASRIKTPSAWVAAGEDITLRVFSFFSSPNVLGIFVSLIIFMSIGLFFKEKKKYYAGIAFINLIVLVFTFSRTAWLGFFIALVVFSFNYYKKALVPVFSIPLISFLYGPVRERILNATSSDYLFEAALDGRLWAIINGWYIFLRHIFWGTGPGTYGGQTAIENASPIYLGGIQDGYTALYYTDNEWLQILVQTGIVGFVSFVIFVATALASIFRKFKEKGDIIVLSVISSLICFLVAGFFSNVLEFGVLSVTVGALIGATLNET